jgi:hypothetical protein
VPIIYTNMVNIEGEQVIGGQFSNSLLIQDMLTITVSVVDDTNIKATRSLSVVDHPDVLFNQGFEDGLSWIMTQIEDGVLCKDLFN